MTIHLIYVISLTVVSLGCIPTVRLIWQVWAGLYMSLDLRGNHSLFSHLLSVSVTNKFSRFHCHIVQWIVFCNNFFFSLSLQLSILSHSFSCYYCVICLDFWFTPLRKTLRTTVIHLLWSTTEEPCWPRLCTWHRHAFCFLGRKPGSCHWCFLFLSPIHSIF